MARTNTASGGGGGGGVSSIAGQYSIVSTPNPITNTGTFSLVNDVANPGPSMFYGTSSGASAVKGWYALPTSSGGSNLIQISNGIGGFESDNNFFYDLVDNIFNLGFSTGTYPTLLTVQDSVGLVKIGDSRGIGNSTFVYISDSGQQITEVIGNSGFWSVNDTAGFQYINVNTSGQVNLGDISGGLGGGHLLIDGTANTATNTALVWNFGNTQIHNVSDPTSALDGANKEYVDSVTIGLSWKNAVSAVTTTALPTNIYNNGASGVGATLTGVAFGALPTIDGVTLTVGMRVLIKDETTLANNGIYVVTVLGTGSASYVLTRSTDNNTGAEMVSATVSSAPNGVVNGNTAFTQSTPATITIGTSSIVWVNFLNLVYTASLGVTTSTSHNFVLDLTHANEWTGVQTFDSGTFKHKGSTSGLRTEQTAATTTNYTITHPAAQGAVNTIEVNNGSGVMSWSLVTTAMLAATTVNVQTGTTYTLQASDNNGIVTLNNASPIILTIPTSLGSGFNCLIVQLGVGQVTPTASGTTLHNRQSFTKTAGQYAILTLAAYVANTFVMSGDMA